MPWATRPGPPAQTTANVAGEHEVDDEELVTVETPMAEEAASEWRHLLIT